MPERDYCPEASIYGGDLVKLKKATGKFIEVYGMRDVDLGLESREGSKENVPITFWVCDVVRPLISMNDIVRNQGSIE